MRMPATHAPGEKTAPLPDADPRSGRPRSAGRKSKFPALVCKWWNARSVARWRVFSEGETRAERPFRGCPPIYKHARAETMRFLVMVALLSSLTLDCAAQTEAKLATQKPPSATQNVPGGEVDSPTAKG